MGKAGFDGRSDEGECIATLLTACFHDRQHRLHESTTRGGFCVPNDSFRQITGCRKARSLALLVAFDAFDLQRMSTAIGDGHESSRHMPLMRSVATEGSRSSRLSTFRQIGCIAS